MASLAVGVVVLALKGFAAYATGSIALYADALESIVNVVTAVVALVAVRLAARPADATLPYGYHKAEYFSAVIIGIFIAVTALLIFREAYFGFIAPRGFTLDPVGIAVSVLATAINAAWALAAGADRAARAIAGATGGWPAPRDRRGFDAGRADRRAAGGGDRVEAARRGARRACRAHHPVVGLGAGEGERDRADGRGGGAASSSTASAISSRAAPRAPSRRTTSAPGRPGR